MWIYYNTINNNMYIFNQRPANEQRLMEYFNKLIIDLKVANNKYKEQNDYLRARNQKLESAIFYSSASFDSAKILKENAKLKRSLRKLYEKYIKPYQGSYADPDSKKFMRAQEDQKIDGVEVKSGDRIWFTPDEKLPDNVMIHKGNAEPTGVWRKLALGSQGKKEWDIWMEGYAATGESGTAQKINKQPIIARTFNEAVRYYMDNNPGHGISRNERSSYVSEEAFLDRRSDYNIWACDLFPTEAEARKSFG